MAYNKSKSKGSAYERHVANQFGKWWCGSELALFRNSGSGNRHIAEVYSGDLAPSSDFAKPWPLSVEVKKAENWSVDGFIKGNPSEPLLAYMVQTLGCAKMGCNQVPLLVCTKNFQKPLIFLSTECRKYVRSSALKHFTWYICRLKWQKEIPQKLQKQYNWNGEIDFICITLGQFFSTFRRENFL